MSTADKLQRLRQTKKDIKTAIEYKVGEIGDIPFSEYAYRLAPEIIQHPNMVARYSPKGRTNQDSDRDCLYDLTGNGYDISLKNFGWSLMSGYGGFSLALGPTESKNSSLNYKTLTNSKLEVNGILNTIVLSDTGGSNKNYLKTRVFNLMFLLFV